MSNHIIETQRLDFLFRSGQPILQQLSLQVPAGSIYGFLGPNGAGKTTTLRLILGLLKKQQGSVTLFGKELASNRIEILKRLGSLIEQPSLYLHLTGRENLEVFRLSYQCPKQRVNEVLDIVKLKDVANKKAKAYSLGMKQRLSIAIALLHDPELLILDEPTNGLDPSGIIETRELIKTLNREHGKTVMVSSHMLAEVEKMATHVGIINKGKLLFQGTLQDLQKLKSNQSAIEIEVSDTLKAKQVLNGHYAVKEVNGARMLVHFESREKMALMNRTLVQEGIDVYQMAMTQNDLENLFIQITSE
ncbi:ABC transporter ATP-binding protein [Paraflavitalea pollutisoli]|uniref:ABC transporter ATP-binding protein n=1 Tax=Paraflavitalea pollutisoli TaxID=3034143 RepID=UPI0023ED6328|nr:ABC transporter ATP-binding protein [Paraflavitalea sp. H1-2-19X]